MRPPAALLLLLLLLAPVAATPALGEEGARRPWAEDLERLLADVEAIGAPGVPGVLTVFGPSAFPVVTTPTGAGPGAVCAAARLDAGRIVAFGHGGYLDAAGGKADGRRLLLAAVRWLAPQADPPRVAVHRLPWLAGQLREAGLDVSEPAAIDRDALADRDVVAARLGDADGEAVAILERHVRGGGGLLTADTGWGWQQLHPADDLARDHPAHPLLAAAGLVYGQATIQRPASGRLPVGPPPAHAHALGALALLTADAAPEADVARDALAVVTRAMREVPPDDEVLLPRLRALAAAEDVTHPHPDRPLRATATRSRLALAVRTLEALRAAPEDVEADPAAAHFPGAVPRDAPRVRRRVAVDLGRPGWHGTGLYARPGQPLRVRLGRAATEHGLALRIGAHTDRLWGKPALRRAPEISVRRPLDERRVEVANAFGGLVYVDVPSGLPDAEVDITIDGAVEAPRFVLGETDEGAWRRTIRDHRAPWGELETDKVVLTLPSEVLRDLDDPAALLAFWDQVMDACADLAARPRDRRRPERYVTDAQISAGYMHAGYPIMTHLDAAPRFVDLTHLREEGDWGMFHEMGHNHQESAWTFAGTVEVTCNLFTVYVLETVCAEGARGHKNIRPETMRRRATAHREAGAPFDTWKREPFLALIPYLQLKERFGWEAYRAVFRTYRDLPPSERPRTDAEKRDQWLVRFSREVGHDLGPFLAGWGIPLSPAARAEVAHLPAWQPED